MTERRRPQPGTHTKPTNGKRPERAKKAAASVSAARVAAFHVLERVAQGRGHSDDLLHAPAVSQLSQEDRNLATALVLGTLRWQIALDARIRALLQRPDIVPAEAVSIALRLGAFQLLHLDRIPAHAAINESVELARTAGHPHAAGMVNAVLRKVATAPAAGRRLHETTAALAERLGHPAWLAERWVQHYGRVEAQAICEFNQQEPGCSDIFSSESDQNSAMPLLDAGSRLVAEIAAASVPAPQRIWDCCAAPGGKSLILAYRRPQAELLATDASPRRLRALEERLEREAPEAKVRTMVFEAQALPASEGPFDLILCDVPCSGTGTLARNPEIRHHLRAQDLPRQAERQKAILSSALGRLAPGGKLVYSTCSLEPEENEAVVTSVLEQHGTGVTRFSVQPAMDALKANGVLARDAELSASVRDGYLRTLPGFSFQGDGFFAAILGRKE